MVILDKAILAAIVLSSAFGGLAQQAEIKLNARHLIGLENVKRNSVGKLTIQNGVMQFDAGTTDAKVLIASIDDLSIGSETTQAGGRVGTVAKTAAIAPPYDSGAALRLLLRTTVDILTVSYRDSGGGLHSAILALPKDHPKQQRTQLIAAGAHASTPAGQELKETRPVVPVAAKVDGQKLSASAIQIETVKSGDVRIPGPRPLRTSACFPNPREAVLFPMTPARNSKPTDGALRAAKQIERNPSFLQSTAEIIDRETGVREVLEILENIIAEAGDVIESRSPELVAQARAALRRYADEAPRAAE